MIKAGVRLGGLVPQMVLAYVIVKEVFADYGCPCVITSANDGKHSVASWHYRGRALDFRTRFAQLDGKEAELAVAVRDALGPDFDVVMEAVGTTNEHLHVEYDPK